MKTAFGILIGLILLASTAFGFSCPSYGNQERGYFSLHSYVYNGITYQYRQNYTEFSSPYDMPVRSFTKGTVYTVSSTDVPGSGKMVVIKHDTQYAMYTTSWHVKNCSLNTGDSVEEGQVIGYSSDLWWTLSYSPVLTNRWYLGTPNVYISPAIILRQICL